MAAAQCETMLDETYKRLVAEIFDARIDYNKDHFHGRLAVRLVDLARPQPGEWVLDIAVGTGLAALPTARLIGKQSRVIGVDLSRGMLERASKAIEAECLGNVELIQADAETLHFPDSTFDLVLCSSALPYMTDIPAALRLWRGFLKPGGRIAFNPWSEGSFMMGPLLRMIAARHGIELPRTVAMLGSPERCRTLLAEAGFPRSEIVIDESGHFLTMDDAEHAWEMWMRNPVFHPGDPVKAARLAGLRDEYRVEARRLSTDQGLWDESTVYNVIGFKAESSHRDAG